MGTMFPVEWLYLAEYAYLGGQRDSGDTKEPQNKYDFKAGMSKTKIGNLRYLEY